MSGIMVIDHDIYLIDMISERILVFEGEPGVSGTAAGPFGMREGMNRFLDALNVTFRRDQSGRPRINKPDSFLDREQKASGEFYYYTADEGNTPLLYLLIGSHATLPLCRERSCRTRSSMTS